MSRLLTYSVMQQKRKTSFFNDGTALLSLRKVNTSYSGYCIKVRRSSDDTTQDIGFVSGVLDESALTTFVGSNDGFLDTWYDQSGNGNNASAVSSSYQPKIVSSGTVEKENSLPIINFGTNDDGWTILFPSGFLNGAATISYFHVAKIKYSYLGGILSSMNAGAGFELMCLSRAGHDTVLRINNVVKTLGWVASTRLFDNNILGLTSIFGNSSSVAAYKNSTSVALTNSAGMSPINGQTRYIGATSGPNYIYGKIAEMLIFTTDKSADRVAIESDINNFYSIY